MNDEWICCLLLLVAVVVMTIDYEACQNRQKYVERENMTRKERKFNLNLKAILGMYGVPAMLRDEFLDRFLEPIREQLADQILGYAKQLSRDAFMIMMRDREHDPAECRELLSEYMEIFEQFDVMANDEAIDNYRYGNVDSDGVMDIVYTKEKIDEAVKPLYEEDFLPYDERYRKTQMEEKHHNLSELKKLADDYQKKAAR